MVSSDKSRANAQASHAFVLPRLHVVHRSFTIKQEAMCLVCLA